MKRPDRISLRPSTEIADRSSPKETKRKVSHKIADGNALSDSNVALSLLASGPARNSQDLNLDWSKFENHTFFDSAAAKVNSSFLRVINEFPFDGTKKEVFTFLSNLTGYERYVYDRFPKSVGYYDFAGVSFIDVKDSTGAEFPEFSQERSGTPVLDPAGGPITFELHISPTGSANSTQVIAQYAKDADYGITLFLSQSSSSQSASLCFAVCSGSLSASVQANIVKDQFQHIAAVYLPSATTSSLELYRNGLLQATSSQVVWLGESLGAQSISIASGSSFNFLGRVFTPTATLDAAIDDLRVYHAARSQEDFAESVDYPDFSEDPEGQATGLRLYYKFNEPPGSHGQVNVALDSSGNSLHGKITGYSNAQRVTGSSALVKEDEKFSPILFPDFEQTTSLNTELLASGSLYDKENPNYIVRLIPTHYFLEGQQAQGLSDIQGQIDSSILGNSIPGSGQIGSVQIITSLLLMYAKVFDEIKIFHDHFAKLTYVDYDSSSSVSDHFLTFLAKYYGFQLPNLFGDATIEQYLIGQRMRTEGSPALPLRAVQAAIFRRVLTNIREIMTSKGTHAGLRALFNAAGIAPNAYFRIREFGGPREVDLSVLRDQVTEVAASLDVSGSLALTPGSLNSLGFASNYPRVVGSYLSGSRYEVGFPEPVGTFVPAVDSYHGVSPVSADGLLTSGSWTFESSYRYVSSRDSAESLARMHVTGTSSPSSNHGVIFNIVATPSVPPTVNAYVAVDSTGATSPVALHITGADVFDGNRWHIALSRTRCDDPATTQNVVSSSYELRCARISSGGSVTFFSSSGYFNEGLVSNNILQNTSSLNTSGSFIVFGSQSLASGPCFLNNFANDVETRTTQFSGRIHSARFWSKALSETEFREHARSFRSLGVDNPIVNFGFNTASTGSFQKLRMDLSCDQDVTGSSASGQITVLDMSQQGRDGQGSGFEASTAIIKPEVQNFTQLSTKFDVRQTTDKVRVRSFTEVENLDEFPDSLPAPLYETTRSERSNADNRLSIEASAVDALNDDIIKLMSTLDFFEGALGDPRVLNEDSYPDLEQLRKIYFNRLVAKPDLRAMYDVFRWVSDALGDLVLQLVPMNSVFLGISYIVESHIAERARVRYYFDSVYKQKTIQDQSSKNVQDPQGSTSTQVSVTNQNMTSRQ